MKPIVAICCCCQKLRDDAGSKPGEGVWCDVPEYLAMRELTIGDIQLSHGYCPSCLASYRNVLAYPNRAAAHSGM
jgi:hypothetical protein